MSSLITWQSVRNLGKSWVIFECGLSRAWRSRCTDVSAIPRFRAKDPHRPLLLLSWISTRCVDIIASVWSRLFHSRTFEPNADIYVGSSLCCFKFPCFHCLDDIMGGLLLWAVERRLPLPVHTVKTSSPRVSDELIRRSERKNGVRVKSLVIGGQWVTTWYQKVSLKIHFPAIVGWDLAAHPNLVS